MKITDEMVKAARDAYQRAYPGGIVGARNIQMRAALQAVADHLEGGDRRYSLDEVQRLLDIPDDAPTESPSPLEGATPAIDREALRRLLTIHGVTSGRSYTRQELSRYRDELADALIALIEGVS